MKKLFNSKTLKASFLVIGLPMFCAGLFVLMYYRFFDFEEATKNLLQWSWMFNFCLYAVLIVERRKKQKEEKAAKEKEITEQKN